MKVVGLNPNTVYQRCTPTFTDQIFLRQIFACFTDKNLQNLHAILCYRFATSAWHGFTKGVSVAPLLLLVSETCKEIVTFS